MDLRKLRIPLSIGALALSVACGSNSNSTAFDSSNDAGTPKKATGGGSGSSSGSSGGASGDDGTGLNTTPTLCAVDSDCSGECDGASVCCCMPSAGTCYAPASGQCGDLGDDSGGGSSDDSGDPNNNNPI
jgi:hypothetical protein